MNMWSKYPQHTIGATEQGRAVHFHFDPKGDLDQRDHFEAARMHDQRRNRAAVEASRYKKLGMKGAENGYRQLAAHHAAQTTLHTNHMNMDVAGERARYPGARYEKPAEIGKMGRGNAKLSKDQPERKSGWRVFMSD